MKRIILAALVGVLVGGPAWAIDEKGSFFLYGRGETKCSSYSAEYGKSRLKQKPDGQLYESWIGVAKIGYSGACLLNDIMQLESLSGEHDDRKFAVFVERSCQTVMLRRSPFSESASARS